VRLKLYLPACVFVAASVSACSAILGIDAGHIGDEDAGSDVQQQNVVDAGGLDGYVGPDSAMPDGYVGLGQDSGLTCDAGAVCGTSCVDLQTDEKNCGRCGHDCQGGTCSNGSCQPVTVASNQTGAWAIAVDSTNVYWTTYAGPSGNGTVMKCPTSGCGASPTTLATNQTSQGQGIATDGTNVYWANFDTGTVEECAVGGCSQNPTTLASGQQKPYGVAVLGSVVYWTNLNSGTVAACASTGCGGAPTTVASSSNSAFGLAVNATSVYWTAGASTVLTCTVAGCGTPTTMASSQAYPIGIAIDTTNVYLVDWSNNTSSGTVMACPLGGCSGGAPTVLASSQDGPAVLAADSNGVYWGNQNGGSIVMSSGGTTTVLASGLSAPYGIAVDAKSVYWTSGISNTVMKVAKP
jgi:hypothetical protein